MLIKILFIFIHHAFLLPKGTKHMKLPIAIISHFKSGTRHFGVADLVLAKWCRQLGVGTFWCRDNLVSGHFRVTVSLIILYFYIFNLGILFGFF